jgi:branched-chain amino acid aminotransferase
METALLNYFVLDTNLRSTCDFNPYILETGIGIYEVLRVGQGRPLFLKEHIDRFFSSAALENVTVDVSRKFIRQAVKMLIEQNRMQQGNIKFIFHRSIQGDNRFMAWVMPFFYPSAKHYSEGVVVGSMQAERENPNAKKNIYSLRKQADSIILKGDFREVVYVNARGHITEGSRSNIFFILGNHLFTPKSSTVLPGITRAKVLQLAAEEKMAVTETDIRLSDMEKFDTCFLTGTSPKILPVLRLTTTTFDVLNRYMRLLMEIYDEMMEADIRGFSW